LGIFLNKTRTVIILFLCCCSCASKDTVREKPNAYLTDSSQYRLLPPENIENPLDMAQLISASYKGRDYFLNAWVKADQAGMEMTLLNELGATMGELSYRNGLASFSSPVLPQSLKPEYIVADFQLCFYSAPALREALEDCGLLFETDENSRRIFQGKTLIIEIDKSQNTVRLVNHLRGYAYTLEGNFR
jgi:hypothetical protein